MKYNYLPGVQVTTVDGGIVVNRTPTAKLTLVVGTSGRGRADDAYPVVDRAVAAQEFGLDGSLIKGMEEVAAYGDNIVLFRMGTSPAALTGVGANATSDGFSIDLGQREADAGTNYKIWYRDGAIYLWYQGNLVYAYDPAAGILVDTGDSKVSGSASSGLTLATADGMTGAKAKTVDGALTLLAAAALPAAEQNTPPDFTPASLGLQLTKREVYVAIEKAFELLENFPVQGVYCPDAVADNPNVAFFVSTDATTAANNPATNPDALDWLKTTKDPFGNRVFHWASEPSDSNGVATPPETFTSASERLGADYHEVSFAYQIARFATAQSTVFGGCMAFIGCSTPPANRVDTSSIRKWIGFLPKVDPVTGRVTAPGSGLLSLPYLVGTSGAKMNSLCHDYTNPGYRSPGLFQTSSNEYDGTAMQDKNGFNVDIGANLFTIGDFGLIQNGSGAYVGSIAGIVAGFTSRLDEKSGLLNKSLRGVRQLYRTGLPHLDALTKAKIQMLRFESPTEAPVLLHDLTSATDSSDYTLSLRVRVKNRFVQQIYEEARNYVGESSTDGMQLAAMKTALDKRCIKLQKEGYLQGYEFNIRATDADIRIGRATVEAWFFPPDELVQLDVQVGIRMQ